MKHSLRSFESLLADLREAREYWSTHGHNLAATRVGTYEREMRKLVEAGPDGRDAFSKEAAGRTYLLLADVSEFLFASKVAASRLHLAQSPRMKHIFSGPDLARDETLSSGNMPRNTLFELTIAAAIELAGLRADISGLSDVRTDFLGRPVWIECKRPQSMSKAETAIRHAGKRLAERASNREGLKLAAVCIGKLLTEGERMLVASDSQAMDVAVRDASDRFFADTVRFWNRRESIDALMVRVNLPGLDQSVSRPYQISLFSTFIRPGLPAERASLVRQFSETLETGLPGESS